MTMRKTILITGASSGFGRRTAETLSNSEHKVFAGFRSTDGAKKQVADELRERHIEILKLDVTDQGSVDSAIAQLLEKSNNELDVVVNNAGMASAGISEAFTPEQARDLFEVNVFGVQRVLRATLPVLRAKRAGLVINVGSILGRITLPFFGLYGASMSCLSSQALILRTCTQPRNSRLLKSSQRCMERSLRFQARFSRLSSPSFKARMLRIHKRSPQPSTTLCPRLQVVVRIAS
jgi:NADP-dependent 3-hydroxy acid dehydrogenase YdfG